ncbi:hypothetical protein F2Q68_00030574 [Brassica cretica]|uniref:Uncharacterized protein n=1 Tax=Brassica cretica TaxID=69181 RepID=A0A8S9G7P7_BRACR|nr:hypothetical protein F2Q68_00030574 [Brassica cretica]
MAHRWQFAVLLHFRTPLRVSLSFILWEGFVFLMDLCLCVLIVLNWKPDFIASRSDNCLLVLEDFKSYGGSWSLIVTVLHLVYVHIPASYQFT